jgi:hypothetical protein
MFVANLELEAFDKEALHHYAEFLRRGAGRDFRDNVIADLIEIWRVLQLVADEAVAMSSRWSVRLMMVMRVGSLVPGPPVCVVAVPSGLPGGCSLIVATSKVWAKLSKAKSAQRKGCRSHIGVSTILSQQDGGSSLKQPVRRSRRAIFTTSVALRGQFPLTSPTVYTVP